jgi:putative transposase
LIKAHFSRSVERGERRSASRIKRGERGIWQRRFWEHCLRDDADYARHVDYVHWNPVKHGYVQRVADWPHSSFHRHVALGVYPMDWGGGEPGGITAGG